jgi:hypothetical protein
LWSDDIPYDQMLNGQAGRILSDPDQSADVVDAGGNLTRSLRSGLTADEKDARGGKSTRDNANIGHKLPHNSR